MAADRGQDNNGHSVMPDLISDRDIYNMFVRARI